MSELTFFQKHAEGIITIWRRDGPEWWRLHYVAVHGQEPPDGWWMLNPRTAAGGQIAPGLQRAFEADVRAIRRRYFEEMERRYRVESGLPARGDGWVSETHLAHLVAEALPGVEILREARLPWLNGQRLDIYLPSLTLAIEYQGIQHYEPIDLFGGDAALAKRRAMDERKRLACKAAGVTLICWKYDEPVSAEAVRRRLDSVQAGSL